LGAINLTDILVTPLSRIKTEGGDVLHAMKNTDYGFTKFGEAYFSEIDFGEIKAWKRHVTMTLNLIVPIGRVKFVFLAMDHRKISAHRIEEIGNERYVRITVPPGIWFGFQGLTKPRSLVLNIASEPHDPNEIERLRKEDVDFSWS
jgi:dTDP-4-dehydrorhamnose 3,5-epimerase